MACSPSSAGFLKFCLVFVCGPLYLLPSVDGWSLSDHNYVRLLCMYSRILWEPFCWLFLVVIFGYVLDLGAILSLRHGLPLAWVSSWTSHCWPLLQVLVAFTPAPHLHFLFPLLCFSYTFLLAWFWTYQECLASGSLHCCGNTLPTDCHEAPW